MKSHDTLVKASVGQGLHITGTGQDMKEKANAAMRGNLETHFCYELSPHVFVGSEIHYMLYSFLLPTLETDISKFSYCFVAIKAKLSRSS